jgi:GntR family transcriptional regulator
MPRKASSGKTIKRPLYAHIHAQLVERIRSGQWTPGQRIPSEFAIAEEFEVSQGTARKALEALSADKLVVRKQGRGTFVFEHTPGDILVRFFNFYDDTGEQISPINRSTTRTVGKANRAERKALRLHSNARVIRIDRLRMRGRKPFITESVSLPEATFPSLVDVPEPPDTFYDVFQKAHNVLVMRTDERVRPVAADARAARQLEVPRGTPLLKIERIAFALGDRPVEWRVSLCHLQRAHYLARTS